MEVVHLMDLAVWELRDLIHARCITPSAVVEACLQVIALPIHALVHHPVYPRSHGDECT